ncbi:MAG: S26 family signal peptidase [Planctomycetota bacterium]
MPDTMISIIMTLALAFLFRAYVVEAFVIPTGSMAPTLMGAHYRVQSPATGAVFAIDRRAGDLTENTVVRDPYSNTRLTLDSRSVLDGDRIFVRKRTPLTPVPERFSVVVFRSPTEPDERVIKRLIGRPGEQVALVDGDVFVRTAEGTDPTDASAWEGAGWSIARKPERVQRSVWQPVFDARYAAAAAAMVPAQGGDSLGNGALLGPWSPTTTGWSSSEAGVLRYAGDGASALLWDTELWEIRDRSVYNDIDDRRDQRMGDGGVRSGLPPYYPVSDLRLAFGYEPSGAASKLEFRLWARSVEFSFIVDAATDGQVVLIRSRPSEDDDWNVLAEAPIDLPTDRATWIECWHADQSLAVYIAGERVAAATYDWAITERIARSIPGADLDALLDITDGLNGLSDPNQYRQPELAVALDGPGALHGLRLDRDLHYHPFHPQYRVMHDPPPLATHPNTTVTLGPGQLFVLGDNSAASRDGRSWGQPDPWVADTFPTTATEGVLPEQLLLGEAFFVYFPAMRHRGGLPIPDFGRMRLIR